jgi:hypothetical protein
MIEQYKEYLENQRIIEATIEIVNSVIDEPLDENVIKAITNRFSKKVYSKPFDDSGPKELSPKQQKASEIVRDMHTNKMINANQHRKAQNAIKINDQFVDAIVNRQAKRFRRANKG